MEIILNMSNERAEYLYKVLADKREEISQEIKENKKLIAVGEAKGNNVSLLKSYNYGLLNRLFAINHAITGIKQGGAINE